MYMKIALIFCVFTVVVVQGLQEVSEFGLDQLSTQDPQLLTLFMEDLGELKKQVQTLANDVSELTSSNAQLRTDNAELKNALEEVSQQKLEIHKNFTRIEKEVKEYNTKIDSLRRYKRRFPFDRIYSPQTDRTASRNLVVPYTNETALEQVLKLLAPATCYDWKVMGFDTSGYYLIDPDGKGLGDPPFIAYCDMYTGYSFVHHDKENGGNATNCGGPGCYKQKLKYEATMKQIEALIDTSQSCQQMISVACRDSPLSENEHHYSWWTDRNGNQMTYWAGNNPEEHACACSSSRSCVDPRKMCNCDSSVPGQWLHDQGYLSNSSALPVTSVNLGSKDELTETQMRYDIGPLRCFGHRDVSHPESCKDLRQSGVTHSGYYYIGSLDSPTLAFCDMQNLEENIIPKKRNVIVYATLSSRWAQLNQIIKFDRVSMNVRDAYDPNTGTFTAPQSGTYYFVVFSYMSNGGQFVLRKNGKGTVRAIHASGSWQTTGISYIDELGAGDVMDVMHRSAGSMHEADSVSELSSFMGMLINM